MSKIGQRLGGRGGSVRLLAEVAAISVGVFLSLWADQWRNERSTAAEGRESLERLAADFAEDTAGLRRLEFVTSRGVDAIDSILNASPSEAATLSSIESWIPLVLESAVYNPAGVEFEALRSSGRLDLISNSTLLASLTSYYDRLEYIAEMYRYDLVQSHEVGELIYPHVEFPRTGYVLEDGPHIFPIPTAEVSATDLLVDRVFVNEMTYLGFLKQLIAGSVSTAQAEAAELLRVIELELMR